MKTIAEITNFSPHFLFIFFHHQKCKTGNTSLEHADKVFASRFTEKPKQILTIADLRVQKEEGEVPVKGFVQVGKTRKVLEKFLNNGTKEEVDDFCEAYAMQLEKDHMRSAMVRQYVVMDIFIVILSFCEKLSDGEKLQEEVQELQTAIQRNGNVSLFPLWQP